MTIYADNAATTKMSEKAVDTMLYYMREIYGNPQLAAVFPSKMAYVAVASAAIANVKSNVKVRD